MSLLRVLLIVCISLCSTAVMADELMELGRAQIKAKRQLVVSNALMLTDETGEKFWPLYREYRMEVDKLDDQLYALVTRYADLYNAGNLSDEDARVLLDDYMKIERATVNLKIRYIKKFRSILPDALVTRYFQAENKLDAVIRYQFAREIPLVR